MAHKEEEEGKTGSMGQEVQMEQQRQQAHSTSAGQEPCRLFMNQTKSETRKTSSNRRIHGMTGATAGAAATGGAMTTGAGANFISLGC